MSFVSYIVQVALLAHWSVLIVAVTGYLIANLAVADFSVGAICIPFTIIYYELNHWPFGYAMCKLLPTAQGMSIMASIGTITAISLGGKKCFLLFLSSKVYIEIPLIIYVSNLII